MNPTHPMNTGFPTPPILREPEPAPIPVADLAYETNLPTGSRRVARLLIRFTIFYAAAALLSRIITFYPLFSISGFNIDPQEFFQTPFTVVAASGYAIDLLALVALIVLAAMLLAGRDAGRALILVCWTHLLAHATTTLLQVGFNLVSTVGGTGRGALPQGYALYYLATTTATLLLHLVFPLLLIALFRGPKGKPLLQSAR